MTLAIDKKLHELDVSEAAAMIASGAMSVLEYNEALLERCLKYEPHIKAFAYWEPDTWRAMAKTLDDEAKAGKLRGPLHGIPIGIKDQFRVGGWPSTIGGTWGETAPSPEDATAVARLRAAGAIIAGITYMPDRDGNPPTCNPWNLAHTPGGSSSGSAASVGARMLPIALGESTGGSNNRPASYCGVEALKPTYGRISGKGLYAISWSLDHPGIIGRSMADMAMIFNAVAGPDYGDPTSNLAPFQPFTLSSDVRPPRIGFIRNFFMDKAEDYMQEAMIRAAAKLGAAGAQVVDIALPEDFAAVWPAWKMVAAAERVTFHSRHAGTLRAAGIDVESSVDELVPATYYLQSQRMRRWLTQLVMPYFDQVDVLYTPAAKDTAPEGHEGGDNVMNSPWATVELPTLVMNLGLAPNGLPLGAQLTAPHLAEEALLNAGAWCEGVLGRIPAPEIQLEVA
jgi:aspartyl-tRNA(Asn)/glutamyl-tRNA(Gln) amidotransferase subunit A